MSFSVSAGAVDAITQAVKGRPPTATGVVISVQGRPANFAVVGDTVSATFQGFNDPDGDPESGTSYQWLLDGTATASTGSSYTTTEMGSLVVEAAPATDTANTDPSIGTTVTSARMTVVGSTHPFIKPDNTERDWATANSYCTGQGAQLPTEAQLQQLFLDATRATVIGTSSNKEMCSVHRWPLDSLCGGSSDGYWSSTAVRPGEHKSVKLSNGLSGGPQDYYHHMVTCIR